MILRCSNNNGVKVTNPDGSEISMMHVGDSVRLEAIAVGYYRFERWWDGVTAPVRVVTVTPEMCANGITVYFNREIHCISVDINPVDSGTVNGDPAFSTCSVFSGSESVVLDAVGNVGYHFDGWSDGSFANPRELSFEFDRDLVANFSTNTQYTVTTGVNDALGGYVVGAGTYDPGDNVTVVATVTNDCMEFVSWGDDASATNNVFTIPSIASSTNMVANFGCIPCSDLRVIYVIDGTVRVAWEQVGDCGTYEIALDGVVVYNGNLSGEGTNYYDFTGLPANSTHTVSVTRNCGESLQHTDTISFTTLIPVDTAVNSSNGFTGSAFIGTWWPNNTTHALHVDGTPIQVVAYGVTNEESLSAGGVSTRFLSWNIQKYGSLPATSTNNPLTYTITAPTTFTASFGSGKTASASVEAYPTNGGHVGVDDVTWQRIVFPTTAASTHTLYQAANSGYTFSHWMDSATPPNTFAAFHTFDGNVFYDTVFRAIFEPE